MRVRRHSHHRARSMPDLGRTASPAVPTLKGSRSPVTVTALIPFKAGFLGAEGERGCNRYADASFASEEMSAIF